MIGISTPLLCLLLVHGACKDSASTPVHQDNEREPWLLVVTFFALVGANPALDGERLLVPNGADC